MPKVVAQSRWPCIVGRRSQAKISKFLAQFSQVASRLTQRTLRLEWVLKSTPSRHCWRELRNTNRVGSTKAHTGSIETVMASLMFQCPRKRRSIRQRFRDTPDGL